eukprot:GILI01013070.1.p1 GENE.GILI01013070.1~~GILI01013070.1.p1  ORF type:complete len:276 (-),score=28.46 GILI01013070.1:151-978(-)
MPAISSVDAVATPMNSTSASRFSVLQNTSPSGPTTIQSIVDAYHTQLSLAAPALQFRKWSLFCCFDGFASEDISQKGRSSRRPPRCVVPSFLVDLPISVTNTPTMTPSASAQASSDEHSREEARLSESSTSRTLGDLLSRFFPIETLESLTWHSRLAFVIGEDEDEGSKRRADLKKSVTVTVKHEEIAGENPFLGSPYNPFKFSSANMNSFDDVASNFFINSKTNNIGLGRFATAASATNALIPASERVLLRSKVIAGMPVAVAQSGKQPLITRR